MDKILVLVVGPHPQDLSLHAKLYTLGDRYGIEKLQIMASNKLYDTLAYMCLSFESATWVAGLVRHVYSNGDAFPQGDKFRQTLELFGACVYAYFLLNVDFAAALADHGEFGAGILRELSRLSPSKVCTPPASNDLLERF